MISIGGNWIVTENTVSTLEFFHVDVSHNFDMLRLTLNYKNFEVFFFLSKFNINTKRKNEHKKSPFSTNRELTFHSFDKLYDSYRNEFKKKLKKVSIFLLCIKRDEGIK